MQQIPDRSTQFSNVQLELLRLYSRNVSEDELLAIKELLAEFFAERAVKGADDWWEANKLGAADVERLLTTKMRGRKSA